MKKIYFLVLASLISLSGIAQSSDGFKYQAIIRDAAGNINANNSVAMEISILQGSADGTAVFTETHNVVSNTFGLVNLTIGSQNPSSFELIDWANEPYFIKIVVDGIEFGTSQLLSVPYALHAKTTEKATLAETAENYAETDPIFIASTTATITQTQIENWTNKLSEFAESDPNFDASVAASITQSDLENWNNKLSEFAESDPEFSASLAKGLTATDTAYWNSKLDDFVESDPTFMAHPSAGITAYDITMWKVLWIWYTTNANGYQKTADDGDIDSTNELQVLSISNDTVFLSRGSFAKLPLESDPIFAISLAKNITQSDTSRWGNDTDTLNEIQYISRSGLTVSLDQSGGTFQDSVNTQNLSSVLAESNDGGAMQIKNIDDPTEANDAATKAYVDSMYAHIDSIHTLLENRVHELELDTLVSTVTDIDANVYKIVKIGYQVWMAENLRTTKYSDGTSIALVSDNAAWSSLGTAAYCWYDNNSGTYEDPYGKLYNWWAASSGKLCPTGWHVPSDAEWTVLIDNYFGNNNAGGYLKEIGTTHWSTPNTGATNLSGFTALPGGARGDDADFGDFGSYGYFWSSTHDSNNGWSRYMDNHSTEVKRYSYYKKAGFSVRCVMD